jgi:hypothetical protein
MWKQWNRVWSGRRVPREWLPEEAAPRTVAWIARVTTRPISCLHWELADLGVGLLSLTGYRRPLIAPAIRNTVVGTRP